MKLLKLHHKKNCTCRKDKLSVISFDAQKLWDEYSTKVSLDNNNSKAKLLYIPKCRVRVAMYPGNKGCINIFKVGLLYFCNLLDTPIKEYLPEIKDVHNTYILKKVDHTIQPVSISEINTHHDGYAVYVLTHTHLEK